MSSAVLIFSLHVFKKIMLIFIKIESSSSRINSDILEVIILYRLQIITTSNKYTCFRKYITHEDQYFFPSLTLNTNKDV